MIEIRLLGPSEVRDGDARISLGGRRQRAALVLLALHPKRVLTAEWMVDQLWTGDPPPSGLTTLRAYISRLRAELGKAPSIASGSDLLTSQGAGYCLDVEPEQVDVQRFEMAVTAGASAMTDGRPDLAAPMLAGALDLWRGEAMADLAYESFAVTEALRLGERRLEALELRIEADLALGEHARVVAELQQLVVDQPLRERFWGQLMVALYRSGRQAEALDTFTRLRRHLVAELGLDPSPGLRRLEEQILRQAPELDVVAPPRSVVADTRRNGDKDSTSDGDEAPPVPRVLGAMPLVGRERQLNVLREMVNGAPASSAAQLAVVTGRAGHGKTRLLRELTTRVAGEGVLVAQGSAELDSVLPYSPFGSLVRSLLDTTATGDGATAQATSSDLAWLVPEVGPPPPLDQDLDLARTRLTEAVLEFLRKVGDCEPLLLVVDDAHLLGRAGAALLGVVLERPWPRPVAVVVAGRPPDEAGPGADAMVAMLQREGTRTVDVGRLSLDEVAQVVERLGRTEDASTRDRQVGVLFEQTGGIPLLVRELLATGSALPEGSTAEIPQAATSPLVRAVIGNRLAGLSAPSRRLVESAAVVGMGVDVELVSAVTGHPSSEVLDALDEAAGLGIMVEQAEVDRFRFDHGLIRDVLVGSVSSARRSRLHGTAAEVYTARGLPLDAGTQALAGQQSLGPRRATALVLSGAKAALASLDFELARRMLDEVLEHSAGALHGRLFIDMQIELGRAAALSGDRSAADNAWSRAASVAREEGDWDAFADVALATQVHGRMLIGSSLGRELLSEAVERVPTGAGERRLLLIASWAVAVVTWPGSRIDQDVLDELESAARSTSDPALGAALCNVRAVTSAEASARREWWERLAACGEQLDDPTHVCLSLFGQFAEDIVAADGDSASTRLSRIEEMVVHVRAPWTKWLHGAVSASWLLLHGDIGPSDERALQCFEIGQQLGIDDADVVFAAHLFCAAYHRGALAELWEPLESTDPGLPQWRLAVGLAALSAGNREAARQALAAGVRDLADVRSDPTWAVSACMAAEVAAALGEAGTVERLDRILAPHSGTFSVLSSLTAELGPVDRAIGLLAASRGDLARAEHHFALAEEVCDRLGAEPWGLRTRADRYVAAVQIGGRTAEPEGVRERAGVLDLGGVLAVLDGAS